MNSSDPVFENSLSQIESRAGVLTAPGVTKPEEIKVLVEAIQPKLKVEGSFSD